MPHPNYSRMLGVRRTLQFLATCAVALVRCRQIKSKTPAKEHPRLMRQSTRDLCAKTLQNFGVAVECVGVDGATLTPINAHEIDARTPRLIVANHTSALDVAVLGAIFAPVALSRSDIKSWPLFGAVAREAGTIFVDRENQMSGMSAIRQIRRELQDGQSVMAFPEGTTNADDALLPFSDGIFAACHGLDVQIVPVGIAYCPKRPYVGMSFTEHLTQIAQTRSTRAIVTVGKTFSPLNTRSETVSFAQSMIQTLANEARHRLTIDR
ncbi:MAG: lysophospholipid acyltransferase family protein [Polyangiales bacterium]